MSDNREPDLSAPGYVEKIIRTARNSADDEAERGNGQLAFFLREMALVLEAVAKKRDAATERGRRQGWSADAATVERVARVWARYHGGDPMRANDPKYDPEDGWPDFLEEARDAIAAIPAPPAPEGE